jgi:hypothetical protein
MMGLFFTYVLSKHDGFFESANRERPLPSCRFKMTENRPMRTERLGNDEGYKRVPSPETSLARNREAHARTVAKRLRRRRWMS